MRLSWPFGRRTPSDGPSAAAPEGPAPSAEPAGPGAFATDRGAPPTGAWAQLPPIQRTVGRPPLVAPTAAFLDAVPGHHPLPPIVTPLGHDAGPAAPAGLVLARPTVVPSLTASTSMPARPVQRRASAPAPAEPGWDAASGAWSAPAPASPVRSLPSVSPAATVTPPARSLTQAAGPLAGPAQRSSASASSSAGAGSRPAPSRSSSASAPGAPAPAATGGSPLPAPRGTAAARSQSGWAEQSSSGPAAAGLGAPLSSGTGRQATSSASTSSASPTGRPGPTSAAPSSADPASRRPGLGAPMSAPPAGTVAQRLPMATPPGRRAMPEIPGQRAVAASVEAAEPGPMPSVAPIAAPAPAVARSLPVLPVARLAAGSGRSQADDHAGHAHPTGSPPRGPLAGTGAASAAAASSGSAGGAPARAGVPTLGSRPLRPSVTAQRATGTDAGAGRSAAGSAAAAGHAALPSPVAARWSTGGELPATVEALPPAFTADESVPLQRLAAEAPAPAASAPREIVFPSRAGLTSGPGVPAFAGAPPVQRSAAAGAEPAPVGFAAAPASTSSRPPAMTLHHTSAPAPGYATPPPAAPAPALQRIVADPAPAAAPVGASRPVGAGSPLAVTATPVVQRVEGTAPEPGGGPTGHSDTELDELARAIFGRIRTHLRSEVIHEREAKGLSFDAF